MKKRFTFALKTRSLAKPKVRLKLWLSVAVGSLILWFFFISNRRLTEEELAPDTEVSAHASRRQQEAVAAEAPLVTKAFSQPEDTHARSLQTGTRLRPDAMANGRGILKIENFSNDDAVARVVVSSTKNAVRTVYIQRGNTLELPGLREGAYRVLFTMGEDWDDSTGEFTKCNGYYEFGKTLLFEEEDLDDGIHYQRQNITLHPDVAGTVPRIKVSRRQFLGG